VRRGWGLRERRAEQKTLTLLTFRRPFAGFCPLVAGMPDGTVALGPACPDDVVTDVFVATALG
jgi:hypothetical protein